LHLLVRTWNVFHGNARPPERRDYLAEMVRLATADGPDVVCLQEVPVWALAHLGRWSGMEAIGAVAARPTLGPLPIPAELGRRLTQVHHGLLRSAFSGQANAILVHPRLGVGERHAIVLNPRSFRRARARELGLDRVARLAWAKERRVCQALRVAEDGDTALVANLHATSSADPRIPDAELLRAACFADELASRGEPVVLAGDFNVRPGQSRTLTELTGPEWGFSAAGAGIDHVLVRGARASEPRQWPEERRALGGRVVSDHAPVEVVVS
jgi:endonuclease/exonuclease/phosphatase family metal-dependent hydrolase